MPDIPYINYKELDEFYTIRALCDLLHLDKATDTAVDPSILQLPNGCKRKLFSRILH